MAVRRSRGGHRRGVPRARRCRSRAATSVSTTRPTARAILPTPVIGVVGVIEDASQGAWRACFRRPASTSCCSATNRGELGGSEYLKTRPRAAARTAAGAGSRRASARCNGCWSISSSSGLDAIGARLCRRRTGGDAGRVLLRHRRHRRRRVDLDAAARWRRRPTGGDALRRVGVARDRERGAAKICDAVLGGGRGRRRACGAHRTDGRSTPSVSRVDGDRGDRLSGR